MERLHCPDGAADIQRSAAYAESPVCVLYMCMHRRIATFPKRFATAARIREKLLST